MGIGRNWTPEEEAYLEEKYGVVSIKHIAKTLNRSETAIVIRSQRMGLGAFLDAGDYVTWNQIQIAIGLGDSSSGYKTISWIKNRDFPIHTKRVKNNSFKVVYLEEFWIWAEKNKDFLNFSGFEPLALGMEPSWVAEKRRNDYQMRRRIKKTPWEPAEEEHLIRLVKQQKYGFMELSGMLNRTEGAIQRRLTELGIKDRPVKADNTVKWTEDEFQILGDMIAAGKRYEQMSETIGKSVKAIRGRVYMMYLTENLDKARELMDGGAFGNNRPERKIKQWNAMNTEERTQVRELMTRLSAIVRDQYKQCFEDCDYWQKDMCQNWDGVCTVGESNCDECVSFQRIRPQNCKRCGKTFFERHENFYCGPCREARRRQHMRKLAVLDRD